VIEDEDWKNSLEEEIGWETIDLYELETVPTSDLPEISDLPETEE
jgi:hypothetical protein